MQDAVDPDTSANELFAEGSQPRNTREKLIFTAVELFYVHGIHAVGLDHILREAGLTKTTFYNHFESKDALVLAAIDLRNRWESEAFLRAMHAKAGYDPQALLLAFFEVIDDWFNDERYRGCLFINAMAEYPRSQDPVHHSAAQHYQTTEATLVEIAKAAGIADPAALAREWVLLAIGALSRHMAFPTGDAAKVAAAIAAARLQDHRR